MVAELGLRTPFNPIIREGGHDQVRYSLPRALIESVEGGSHVLVSEGVLTYHQIEGPQGLAQQAVADQREFEGWRHSDDQR